MNDDVVVNLIACHECDLLHREVEVPPRSAAVCGRCGATLYRNVPDSLDRTLAYTLAASLLFIVANAFPIVQLDAQGNKNSTTLFGAVRTLHEQDMTSVAALVFFTTILTPALQLGAMLCMLLPLKFGHVPGRLTSLYRLVLRVRPWAMVEVFLLGMLVSLAKLVHFASLTPDVALWSFAVLIVLIACASSSFDARSFWQRVERAPS